MSEQVKTSQSSSASALRKNPWIVLCSGDKRLSALLNLWHLFKQILQMLFWTQFLRSTKLQAAAASATSEHHIHAVWFHLPHSGFTQLYFHHVHYKEPDGVWTTDPGKHYICWKLQCMQEEVFCVNQLSFKSLNKHHVPADLVQNRAAAAFTGQNDLILHFCTFVWEQTQINIQLLLY